MDRIELKWHDAHQAHMAQCKQLHIFINGQSLTDLVRSVELPFAELEGCPDLAGQYDWLVDMYYEIQHLRTEDCMVLGCNCGIPDCWPLTVRVSMADDIVCWSHFQNWHCIKGCAHEWDHSASGPFVFDHQQYEAEVKNLSKQPSPQAVEILAKMMANKAIREGKLFTPDDPKNANVQPDSAETKLTQVQIEALRQDAKPANDPVGKQLDGQAYVGAAWRGVSGPVPN